MNNYFCILPRLCWEVTLPEWPCPRQTTAASMLCKLTPEACKTLKRLLLCLGQSGTVQSTYFHAHGVSQFKANAAMTLYQCTVHKCTVHGILHINCFTPAAHVHMG